ncbi:MAG: AzlC family ABC transporter permease, partial [Gaiella sp.]
MRGEAEFGRGFRAMVPLWLGVIPFGVAYAVLARDIGLSIVETQALSVLVFAGSAQFSAVGLIAAGSGGASIVLATLLLNVRHLLYGLSLGRAVPMTRRQRP